MFDLGWSELLVIGVVALIVVGPKDLPGMFRTLGRFTAKIKSMARDFQRAMDDAADEAGMKEAARDLKDLSNPRKMGLDALKGAADSFEKWEPGKSNPSPKGPATEALSEERAEVARKIRDAAAERASKRVAAEKAAEAAAEGGAAAPAPKPAATGKKATKRPAAKKTAAKKPAAKKAAAKTGAGSGAKSDDA